MCDSRSAVDTPPPAGMSTTSLTAALAEAWSIEADDLEYVPKGVGSYHWRAVSDGAATYFITVDDLDSKPWLGRDRGSTFERLVAAYATAWTLHHDDGLSLVVAPIRADDGSTAVRLDDRYTFAVFPYVDGTAGSWGQSISPGDHVLLARELAHLHDARHGRRAGIERRPHALAERVELMEALNSLGHRWTGGAYSERARRALDDNAVSVVERLARFDELATRLDRAEQPRVVTHGEPHPGNLIWTSTGLRLIDWDTVALAEPERDLWMLLDGHDAYTEMTGHSIDPAAMEFYALAWTLSDIASFAAMFRAQHERTRWAERKWRGFVSLLEGGTSRPYGPFRRA